MDNDVTALITVDEVCETLMIGKNTAYRLLAEGKLKGFRAHLEDTQGKSECVYIETEWDGIRRVLGMMAKHLMSVVFVICELKNVEKIQKSIIL